MYKIDLAHAAYLGEIITYCPACRSPFSPDAQARAEFLAPAANRLVADRHSTLEQQLFDLAQAELEPEVPTHRMANDRRREPVAVIKRFRFRHRIMLREHPANVTAPQSGVASGAFRQ